VSYRTDYIVVMNADHDMIEFIAEIRERSDDGYTVAGGIAVSGEYLYQAMTKKVPK
jgi:hypothetical protein